MESARDGREFITTPAALRKTFDYAVRPPFFRRESRPRGCTARMMVHSAVARGDIRLLGWGARDRRRCPSWSRRDVGVNNPTDPCVGASTHTHRPPRRTRLVLPPRPAPDCNGLQLQFFGPCTKSPPQRENKRTSRGTTFRRTTPPKPRRTRHPTPPRTCVERRPRSHSGRRPSSGVSAGHAASLEGAGESQA